MNAYTKEALADIIDKHSKWLCGDALGERANLSCANLYGANLSGANLSCADLYGADLRRANLSGANLRRATLSGADLRRADLSGADLRRADLYGANLSCANLSGANLSGADLSGADLRRASLSGANLRRANLSGANLRCANLSCANLSGANLLCMGNMHNIKTIQADIWKIGYTHDTMQIGCQRHLIAEWWGFSDDEISRMSSQALSWWKVWKPMLMAMIDASPAEPTGYVEDEA